MKDKGNGGLGDNEGGEVQRAEKIKPHERSSFGLWVSAFAEGHDQTSSVVFVRECVWCAGILSSVLLHLVTPVEVLMGTLPEAGSLAGQSTRKSQNFEWWEPCIL